MIIFTLCVWLVDFIAEIMRGRWSEDDIQEMFKGISPPLTPPNIIFLPLPFLWLRQMYLPQRKIHANQSLQKSSSSLSLTG